jgi:hypothetical protein
MILHALQQPKINKQVYTGQTFTCTMFDICNCVLIFKVVFRLLWLTVYENISNDICPCLFIVI